MGRCLEGGRLTGSNSDETDVKVSWDLTMFPLGPLNLPSLPSPLDTSWQLVFCHFPSYMPTHPRMETQEISCLAPTKRMRRKDVCMSEAETCLVLKMTLMCKAVDFRITYYLDLKEHKPALGRFVQHCEVLASSMKGRLKRKKNPDLWSWRLRDCY